MGDKSKPNLIQLNGRLYDALTGQPAPTQISPSPPAAPVVSPTPTPAVTPPAPALAKSVPHTNGTTMDGVVSQPSPAPATMRQSSEPMRTPRPASSVHQTTNRPQTLNRDAVTKPAPVAPKTTNIGPSSSLRNGPPMRAERAATTPKSTAISKFGDNAPAPAPVQPPIMQPNPATPAPSIEEGLARAGLPAPQPKAHKQNLFKSWFGKGHRASVAATVVAGLLLTGYVAYLNIPRMAMRVAASRAGFEAQVPGYSPDGFRFSGPISYSPGQITVQYSSADNKTFTITEKETNWDSQTLLESHVEQETDLYSTYQERGLIVYIYDGSNATWVNGGIWYTVDGNSHLNSEQLLKVASSL